MVIRNGDDLGRARRQLNMDAGELGRKLRLKGDPGTRIWEFEQGQRPISGPLAVAVEAMLAGFRPADV